MVCPGSLSAPNGLEVLQSRGRVGLGRASRKAVHRVNGQGNDGKAHGVGELLKTGLEWRKGGGGGGERLRDPKRTKEKSLRKETPMWNVTPKYLLLVGSSS